MFVLINKKRVNLNSIAYYSLSTHNNKSYFDYRSIHNNDYSFIIPGDRKQAEKFMEALDAIAQVKDPLELVKSLGYSKTGVRHENRL